MVRVSNFAFAGLWVRRKESYSAIVLSKFKLMYETVLFFRFMLHRVFGCLFLGNANHHIKPSNKPDTQPGTKKPAPKLTPSPAPKPTPTSPVTSFAVPNPVPANQTWAFCSKQYQGCDFSGLRDVRFGHGQTWVMKEFYNSTQSVSSCRAETFGLPSNYYDPDSYCEVSTHVKTGTLPPPVMAMGPSIDLTKIPLGSKGSSEARIAPASSDPNLAPTKHNDGIGGEFRTHCDFSHMSFDDPIVYPGQVGKSHLHTFFGNTRTWAGSTALSISSSGNSTCAGGITNRTAYRVPTLIDTLDGRPLVPEDSIWYYKNGSSSIPAKDIHPIPKGLRMIAGNAMSSPADSAYTGWSCWNGGGQGHSIPTACAVGDYVVMNVNFPQC